MNNFITNLKIKIANLYLLFKYKELPFYSILLAAITLTYALSPIDLIPDFIPILGYLDDLIILPILIYITYIFIPTNIRNKHKEEAILLIKKLPKKWYFGLLIVMLWGLIIFILYTTFL